MSISPTIAAIVIAKNEASNIARCLKSLAWCHELVVIDDHSTDGTVELATEQGARVVTHPFETFAKQRNWAITEAGVQSDWLLLLDADEVASEAFAREVRRAIESANEQTVAFRTCRKTMFLGRWLKRSDGFPVWIMRIVRRGHAVFQDSGHGEIPVPPVSGHIGTIAEPFIHYPFSKGLSDWLERHNRYSSREAAWEFANQSPVTLGGLFAADRSLRRKSLRDMARRMPFRPLARFGYQYVAKLGFLDGRPGLTFSALMAYYEWMIVLKRRELELRQAGIEL